MGYKLIHKNSNKKLFGIGIYEYNDIHDCKSKAYEKWASILRRCIITRQKEDINYKAFNRDKIILHTYHDVEVCDEWLYFKNFVKWFDEYWYEIDGEKMDIDKDIIGNGKLYSSKTCCIVPHCINCFFLDGSKDNGLMQGVHWDNYKKKYIGMLNVRSGKKNDNGKKIQNRIRKAFNNEYDAGMFYKKEKEKYARELAEEFKDYIDVRVYEKLMNYEVKLEK